MNTTPVRAKTADTKNDVSFNFNATRMKEAVEAPSHLLPKDLNFTEFEKWVKEHQPK